MSGNVVFYRLNTRFLDQGDKPPPISEQIVYYSLAVGHHVGVIDTLIPVITWPYAAYLDWVGGLPEGEARRKLDGVRRFGEIMIDASHTVLLRTALQPLLSEHDQPEDSFPRQLDEHLEAIQRELAIYIMVRRQA